ncbi:MAG: hypothetical protein PHP44_14115, partial [Kiritimatiellae bacterium]|nr:hypothetical protein [Kiritimatiellia bacterium]
MYAREIYTSSFIFYQRIEQGNPATAGDQWTKFTDGDNWDKQWGAYGGTTLSPDNDVVFTETVDAGGYWDGADWSDPGDITVNYENSKSYIFNVFNDDDIIGGPGNDVCGFAVSEINHQNALVTLSTPVFSNTQSKVWLNSKSSAESSGSNEEIWFMWTKDYWTTRRYHEVTNISANTLLELDIGDDVDFGDMINWVVETSSDTDTSTVQGTTSGVLNYDAMAIERQTCNTKVLNTVVRNPSFEVAGSSDTIAYHWADDQPDDYGNVVGDASRESWGAQSGTWMMSLHNWTNGSSTSYMWQEISNTTVGAKWNAKAWFWSDNNYTADMELQIQFRDSSKAVVLHAVTNAFSPPGAVDGGSNQTVSAISPSSVNYLYVVVMAKNQGTDGAIRVDDIELYNLDTVPATNCYVTNNIGEQALSAYWNPPDGYDVMVVRRAGDWPDAPTDGTTYTNRQTYGTDSRNLVVYAPGKGIYARDYDLTAGTTYYYSFFTEYDGNFSLTNGTTYSGRSKSAVPTAFVTNTTAVDHFSYMPGDIHNVEDGGSTATWSGPWTHDSGAVTIYSNGLFGLESLAGATNYPEGYGSMVKMDPGNGNSSMHRVFGTKLTTGTLYIAFNMNVESPGAKRYAGMDILDGTTNRMMLGLSGGATALTVQRSSDYSEQGSSYTITGGVTYTYVCKYDFSASTLYGYVWCTNETIPRAEPTVWLTSLNMGAGYLSGIDRIRPSCGGWDEGDPGDVYYDEIHIATNWFDLLERTASLSPTWTGGCENANFSYTVNWDPDYPAAGAEMTFTDSTSVNPTNDYGTNRTFTSVLFDEDAAAYTLHGTGYSVSNLIENLSSETQTIDADIRVASTTMQINPVNQNITVESNIYLNGSGSLSVLGNGSDGGVLTANGKLIRPLGANRPTLWVSNNASVVFNEVFAGTNTVY